jgi:acetyl esterase/lipase
MLYRGMDRAALDAAYNNAAAVPDSARWKEDWAGRSAAMRARHPGAMDLPYAGRESAATLIFIHGGYWQMNAKEPFAFVAEGMLAHGINVASVGYTLAPEAGMDAIVGEIRDAVGWLAGNIARHGGDPARLYVSGWSAGGHLAAMAMSDPASRAASRSAASSTSSRSASTTSTTSSASTRRRCGATARSSTFRRAPEGCSSPSAATSCPSCSASRGTITPRGPRTASTARSCRCRGITTSRSSRSWRGRRASSRRR